LLKGENAVVMDCRDFIADHGPAAPQLVPHLRLKHHYCRTTDSLRSVERNVGVLEQLNGVAAMDREDRSA
jgi:hypothetical protein